MRPRTVRAGAVLALLALGLPAQEPEPAAPQRQRTEAVTVSLSFTGGTMAAFIDALRRAEPEANIVMGPHAVEAVVPPMELRGAGLAQALESASVVAEGPVDVRVKEFEGEGQSVYTILAVPRRRQTQVQGLDPDEIQQRVFTLNQLTSAGDGVEPLSVATVLSAVEFVTSAAGEAPLLRYHQDSGLLLVRGTPDQVAHASETLAVLKSDLDDREARARAERAADATKAQKDETPTPREQPREGPR